MRALTTSELNQLLIEKGYKSNNAIDLPSNKWGANRFVFEEDTEGYSTLNLTKKIGEYMSKTVIKYSKMNASDKKEFVSLILG